MVFFSYEAEAVFITEVNFNFFLIPEGRGLIAVVIGQKGESQNERFGKLGVFCFLETLVLRFALLSYYRRLVLRKAILS